MLHNRIRWDDAPPRTSESSRRVLSFRPGRKYSVIGLGRLLGVWTHWDASESRTAPCLHEQCPLCPRASRWRGYFPALVFTPGTTSGTWEERVVEVTPDAAERLLRPDGSDLCASADLRGLAWRLGRFSHARNSPITAEQVDVTALAATPLVLPPEWDIRSDLLRLWGYSPSRAPEAVSDAIAHNKPYRR